MAGLAWSGIGSPDGRWLLTLYLNTGRNVAFVHALDLVRSSPLCIFLPSGSSFGALKRYGLTLSPDGRRLYATNAAIGAVAEIDLATRKVVRTARFPATRNRSGPGSLDGDDLAERPHALLQPRPGPLGVRHGVRGRPRPVPDWQCDRRLRLRRRRPPRPRPARRRSHADVRRRDRRDDGLKDGPRAPRAV